MHEPVDDVAAHAEERARNAEILSIVAHDIRGPLGVILVAVSELLDGRVGAVTDEQRALVQLVRRSCERLGRLAANVAFLEKASTGEPALSRTSLDLRDIARRAVESFERSGEVGKRLKITLRVPEERVGIEGDAELLVQACVNVLANAVRAGKAEIIVSVESDAGVPVLLVDDDGPGIPDAMRPTLFESKCRGAGEREPRGLGLPIVRGILQAHGAAVTAGSRPVTDGRPAGARIRMAFGPQL